MPQPDIFLSYSRSDSAKAKLFAEAFEECGLKVWWDTVLRSGEAYDEVTEAALRGAKATVVLWSRRSVVSRWVRAEATLADRSATLMPCMIEPCERPIMFELTQTAELAHWTGAKDDKSWCGFLRDVQRMVESHRSDVPDSQQAVPGLREIVAEPPPPRATLVAVLPFENLSSDTEMNYFSDGISEDILGHLARSSDLRVAGRASSFAYRGADKRKAPDGLNATHIVDGSVRRAANKIRISAHLSETEGHTTLWSDHYDRDLDDIFAVQDEISQAIATALDVAFAPVGAGKVDPETYDRYLNIRAHMYTDNDARRTNALTADLVRSAPDFAEGWALHALTTALLRNEIPFRDRPPLEAESHAAIERCLELAPDSPNVFSAQWALCRPFGQFLEQHKAMLKMMEHWERSSLAEFSMPFHLECVGRSREAIALLRDFQRQNPAVYNSYLGMVLWRSGRFAEGRAVLEKELELLPVNHHTRATLAGAYWHDRDMEAARRLLDPAVLARYPLYEYSWLTTLAEVVDDGSDEKIDEYMKWLQENFVKDGAAEPNLLSYLAAVGEVDDVFAVAESVRFGPSGGPADVLGATGYRTHHLWSAQHPQFREDPRFVKICARLGLVEYWLATELWPDCADEVPYDFRAECEKYRDYPKDPFIPEPG
uniref:TIR domain-containing protein n=1 Tax=Parerythrobacter lutipelagi TaxID=1964208 RepID=UPI0010FA525F|nr:TIR domain-containing protein [Parerythrobacter lutipelagi]